MKLLHVAQVDYAEKSLKRKEPSINQTQLWHLRLSHINLKILQILVSCGPLATLNLEQLHYVKIVFKVK